MGKVSLEIISMWFSESFLAPFFLNHYRFADRIRIIDDVESSKDVRGIVSQYPNASLEYIKFPDRFDNDIAVAKVNECYAESTADWVVYADADEFILEENLKDLLAETSDDIFYVRLYQVYRTVYDSDLDVNIPIGEQRRCGDAYAVKGNNRHGKKPMIVRGGLKKMKWQPGQHNIWNRHKWKTSDRVLLGSHWIMADPCFCIERRMRGKARQSQANVLRGNSCHYNTITEEQVIKELEEHKYDRRLF